jgi:hypothetical protein
VGLSTEWTGCLLNPQVVGSRMQTLLATDIANDAYINSTNRHTFENDSTAVIPCEDAYGRSFIIPLLPDTIKHTLLSELFKAWNDPSSNIYIKTSLKPVVVGSVYTPIKVLAPLLATGPTIIGAYIAVQSAEGFNIGDRIRVFGTVDSASPNTALNKYTTVLSICLYSDLVVAGAITNPTTNDPSVLTMPVLVVDNTSATGLNLASSTILRKGGYVINCMSDNVGGRIQLLTDEFEFRPITVTPTACTANSLSVNLPGSLTSGEGFLRTFSEVIVKLEGATDATNNGYYTIESVSGTSSMVLKPYLRVLNSTFSGTAKLSLAPNSITLFTQAKDKSVANGCYLTGLQLTEEIQWVPPAYPPVATQFTHSWKRAYTPTIEASSYRYLQWKTQDIAPEPSPPLVQQDFGDTGLSSYYNVYNMQTFLDECVNPALEDCIYADFNVSGNLTEQSLQVQIVLMSQLYEGHFNVTNESFAYNPQATYTSGTIVNVNKGVWVALATVRNITPGTPYSAWLRLGDLKEEASPLLPDGNLQFYIDSVIGPYFQCKGLSMLAEKVHFGPTITLKTKAPKFKLGDNGLFFYDADVFSFGNLYPYVTIENFDGSFIKDIRNYNYKSWGYKNAAMGTGSQGAEEFFTLESNSSFKFLMDNFDCSAIEYTNPETNDTLCYWDWNTYGDVRELSWPHMTRRFTQASESLSSCLCPVQSIVITSRTIPVVPTLASQPTYISDFNSSLASTSNAVTGETENVIGEFDITPGSITNIKSVIRYQPDHVTYYSLQSTKTFKQLDYNVCYRHRITQKLVPLILSNYGNVNIKFVFKPT